MSDIEVVESKVVHYNVNDDARRRAASERSVEVYERVFDPDDDTPELELRDPSQQVERVRFYVCLSQDCGPY